MFKVIDDKKILTHDEAREKYKGCMILLIRENRTSGRVYAISDNAEAGKIAALQLDFYDKGIETVQVNSLVTGVDIPTLYVEKCELL